MLPFPRCFANGLDTWDWRHPLPQGNYITAFAHGKGIFVASAGRSMITSSNAIDWENHPLSTDAELQGIAFANETFVAVGSGGAVFSSPDGSNWVARATGNTNLLHDIAFGNGLFVAVGFGGTILTSSDGQQWTDQSSAVPETFSFMGIGFGNGMFVAVANANDIATSVDGISWSTRTGPGEYPRRVAYGNGTYVAAGSTSQYSKNGVNWGSVDIALASVTFGNGLFVGVGDYGRICVSTNGAQWICVETNGTSDDLFAAGFGNGAYVVGGHRGLLRTSTNGTNWSTQSSALTQLGTLYSVVYAGNQFVAVGERRITSGGFDSDNPTMTSPDGVDWTRRSSATFSEYVGIAYGNGVYVALARYEIAISSNGITWTNFTTGVSSHTGITYGNRLFVIVTAAGQITTSADGKSWTQRTSPTTRSLRSVTYGGDRYVAVGPGSGVAGVIVSSADGIEWTPTGSNPVNAVTWNRGMFVAARTDGRVQTSSTGTTWTTRSTGNTNPLYGVTWGHGRFVAVGRDGTILSSPDGITWTRHQNGTSSELYQVAAGPESFVVVGGGGAILQSGSLPNLAPIAYSSGLGFDLQLLSRPGRTYRIEYTGDTKTWTNLTSLTPTGVITRVYDSSATAAPSRLYRAVSQ